MVPPGVALLDVAKRMFGYCNERFFSLVCCCQRTVKVWLNIVT